MHRIKVLTDIEELEGIYNEWEYLVKESSASPFQSPLWLIPWYKYFGSGELRVFTIWDKDTLMFVAPLFIGSINKENERKLVFIGTGNSDYLDCIYLHNVYENIDSFMLYIADIREQWDVCDLSDIPSASPLINYLNAACYDVCPVLEIKGTFKDYLRTTFSRKRLYNTKRMERKLREEGELSFEILSHNSSSVIIRNALKDFDHLHIDSLFKDFLFESVPLLFGRDYAKLFRLQHNKKTIAAELVFVKDECVYDYLIAYHPDYDKFSPGFILKIKIIEWCYNNNISYFDFLKGKEEDKYSFGAKDNSTFRINIPSK